MCAHTYYASYPRAPPHLPANRARRACEACPRSHRGSESRRHPRLRRCAVGRAPGTTAPARRQEGARQGCFNARGGSGRCEAGKRARVTRVWGSRRGRRGDASKEQRRQSSDARTTTRFQNAVKAQSRHPPFNIYQSGTPRPAHSASGAQLSPCGAKPKIYPTLGTHVNQRGAR